MLRIEVTDRQGSERIIECAPSMSLMEAIRDAGFDELLALCGGCCSCATCHVYVAPECLDRLAPANSDEDALLDGSSHKRADSRLSCQVRLEERHDRLKVSIAPED